MEDQPRTVSPSVRQHKRQFIWQILVPVIAAALIIILVAVFVVTQGASTDRSVADISIMWMIIPILILALIVMAVLCGLIYGMIILHKITPKYTGKAQSFLVSVQNGTRKVADGSARPFIWIDQAGAALKSIFKR
jgi:hypothetical protein